jgi:hypothetical protein
VFWRIKMSCLATFSYGYFQASVVLFLPLYLIERGITEHETIIMPTFFALGMLLFANAAAQQGDKRGHLAMMRILGIVGTVTRIAFVRAAGRRHRVRGRVRGGGIARPEPSAGVARAAGPDPRARAVPWVVRQCVVRGRHVGAADCRALFTAGRPAMITHGAGPFRGADDRVPTRRPAGCGGGLMAMRKLSALLRWVALARVACDLP